MPVFNNLSLDRAHHILRLADESFRTEERSGKSVFDPEELMELLSEPPRPERAALLDELGNLTHAEALDLVGIMYVGRGDYVEDEANAQQVADAFNAQLSTFSLDSVENLVQICAGKDLVFHQYLRRGLDLLA